MTSHRATKTGLDYFSFDVDFFEDPKVQFISAKYGILGENVVIKLLCRVYRNGYYLPWGEDECLLFTRKNIPEATPEQVQEIISEAVKRGLFSEKHLSEYSILTSNGIQKRFLEATRRRKRIAVHNEYLIADIDGYDVNILPLDGNIFPQSKVKESKVKKKTRARAREREKAFETFWKAYPRKVKKKPAFEAFKKIPHIESLSQTFPGIIKKQIAAKLAISESGGFAPEFPDPERWLKHQRWTDEIQVPQKPSSKGNGGDKDDPFVCSVCGLHKQVMAKSGLCFDCGSEQAMSSTQGALSEEPPADYIP